MAAPMLEVVVYMSYPLGWSLTTRIEVQRERWPGGYDVHCVPLVPVGAHVEPDQPVIHLERSQTPGALLATPEFAPPMNRGQPSPGVMHTEALTQDETSTSAAGLRGTVIALSKRGGVVIKGTVALIGGTLGVGKQVVGPLVIWQAPGTMELQCFSPGTILAVPGPLNLAMLRQVLHAGIVGVIASSISSRDLEYFLHIDLINLLSCSRPELLLAHLPPLTILLTEGLGTLAMPVRTIDLLNRYQGATVLLSGFTSCTSQIYPELLIPLSDTENHKDRHTTLPETQLRLGSLVRVCSGSYEGVLGEIDYLFAHQQLFPSGVRERAARLRLEDGSLLTVPLPVLERLG